MLATLFSFDPITISTFMTAAIILNLTPGSDVMFSLATGMSGGTKNAISAAAGITFGTLIHVTLATLGLSALLLAYPAAYDTIRYLGAAYLVYLAVVTWRSVALKMDQTAQGNAGKTLVRGFVTNILNPKVALFFVVFLPQFADPKIGPIWQQILLLGIMFATSGFLVNSLYGIFAGLMAKRLKQATGILNKVSAIVFGGLAGRLVLE